MKIYLIYIILSLSIGFACNIDNIYSTFFGYKVKYEVTGSNDIVNISYSYDKNDIVELQEVNLPWTYEFKITSRDSLSDFELYVYAENKNMNSKKLNTRIYINDQIVMNKSSKHWSSVNYKITK